MKSYPVNTNCRCQSLKQAGSTSNFNYQVIEIMDDIENRIVDLEIIREANDEIFIEDANHDFLINDANFLDDILDQHS